MGNDTLDIGPLDMIADIKAAIEALVAQDFITTGSDQGGAA